ncbi:hypothetical protein ACFSJM_06900 [Lactococcus formosensis subsp. bovis]|uniref:hypothetical protein n=1 Tax=Lactococcus formosensis TaxID=1281486 RepID=UPI001BD0FFBB|nr:hypothetical protein [Lactococcus formosensis]
MRSNPRHLQTPQEEVVQPPRKKSRKILWASLGLFTVVLVAAAIVMFNQQEEHFKQIRAKNTDIYATQKSTSVSSSSEKTEKKEDKPKQKGDKKSEEKVKKTKSDSKAKVTPPAQLSKVPVDENVITAPQEHSEETVQTTEVSMGNLPQVTRDEVMEVNEASESETTENASEANVSEPQKVIIRPAKDIDLKVYIGQDVETVTDELVKEGAIVIWNYVNSPSTPSHHIISVEGHDNVATFIVAR